VAQDLPDSDAFANTSFAAQPPFWCSWVGAEPAAAGWGAAWLHDGYLTQLGGLALLAGAACTFSDSLTVAAVSEPRAFVYRREQAADVDVDASFQVSQFPGFTGGGTVLTPANSFFAVGKFSVFARVSAGTLTDSTLSELRYVNCTGYELRASVGFVSGFDIVFQVWRWVAGVATLMAEQTYVDIAPITLFQLPFGLRLRLETVAGNPTLKAYVGPLYLAGLGQFSSYQLFQANGFTVTLGSGVTNSAGTLTDAHASKITADGHVGFVMMRDRQVTSGTLASCKVVDLCHFVRARNLAGDVQFEERWGRIYAGAQLKTVSDGVASVVGRLVSGDYLYDQHASASIAQEFEWDSANERAVWSPAASAVTLTRFFLGLRPADNSHNQRRSVSIMFVSGGSEPDRQRAGVVLRATAGTAATSNTGYLLAAEIDYAGANTYTLRLSRVRAGVETLLATSPGAGVFVEGVAFELDLDCHSHPDSPDIDGPVRMIAQVDGSPVTWTLAGVVGVSLQSSGEHVLDQSADRIQSGFAEGLYATHLGLNSRDIAFDAWTQEALEDGALSPDAMESIPIEDEGTAVGSLDDVFRTEFTFEVDPGWDVSEVPFESGHVATRPLFPEARRVFKFVKRAATPSEVTALRTFFNSHFGIETPFNWIVPHTGVSTKAAIMADTLTIVKQTTGAYAVAFDVVELGA